MSGACIALEKRFAFESSESVLSQRAREEAGSRSGRRTCLVISSCSSRANVANVSYFVPILEREV